MYIVNKLFYDESLSKKLISNEFYLVGFRFDYELSCGGLIITQT